MFNFILPNFHFRIERWKWNKEYRVYVSTFGNFKDEYKNAIPIKITPKGYCTVKTSCGLILAHRLVMFTWNPIPNAENLTVDHLNHNKRDNSVSNLEWVSFAENQTRAKQDLVSAGVPKTTTYIYFKNKKFLTYRQAALWLKDKHPAEIKTEEDVQHVINKIKNSVKHQSVYYGKIWEKR
jgi:hypothetical protein